MQEIRREEVVAWRSNRVTEAIIEQLRLDLQDLQDEWANGGFTDASTDGTVQRNAEALGKVRAIIEIVDYFDNLASEGVS